jgi:hypothetical protein
MIRNLLAFVCCVMFLAHFTIGMQPFVDMFDLGVSLADTPYVLAIPGMAFFTLYMLRV